MISIIIPTLNEEDYLPKLLESIKRQTFTDYEVIVADAGSQDTTITVAQSYHCNVVAGGLPAVGRNHGAESAKGELLLFLDADTILSDNFLEQCLDEFKKRNLDAAVFPILPIDGIMIDRLILSLWNIWVFLVQKVLTHGMSAFLVKKSTHELVGGFDESVVFAEDQHYIHRVGNIARFGILKLPIYISTRRFKKDGRFITYGKYIIAELHILFLGPIKTNIFKYNFGHYKDNSKNKS